MKVTESERRYRFDELTTEQQDAVLKGAAETGPFSKEKLMKLYYRVTPSSRPGGTEFITFAEAQRGD